MAESETLKKGREIRRQLLGDEYIEKVNRTAYADPMMQEFVGVTTEGIFGLLWSRPGLDLKTRTLVCCVSDAATGALPELGIHVRMALRQGWTKRELTEALLHLVGYAGAPKAREALLKAKEVFGEMDAG